MASIRLIKKDIDYLVSEVIGDCYLALYFHENERDAIVEVIRKAVELRNKLFDRANNIPEKNNPGLVKKHFRYINEELLATVDELFGQLSGLTQKKKTPKQETAKTEA